MQFTREELQDIRDRAEQQVDVPGLSRQDQIAYLELASAADRVDATLARTQFDLARVKTSGDWPSGPVQVSSEE